MQTTPYSVIKEFISNREYSINLPAPLFAKEGINCPIMMDVRFNLLECCFCFPLGHNIMPGLFGNWFFILSRHPFTTVTGIFVSL